MAQTTKTLNPLPFTSLEPKRFEDLIRGLIYDLKKWRQLEATGRSGDDSGFDIRGWEVVDVEEADQEETDETDGVEEPKFTKDRLWLIQGKREKSITPKKMEGYLDDIFKENKKLYGVIFAAACDFSKETRDLFRKRMIKERVQEFALWSGAELEDMLFQPKNDNLLFAFFGISLQIKKKTLTTRIRSKITIKSKAIKVLGSLAANGYKQVLIRDPEDEAYPFKENVKDFDENPHWIEAEFSHHYYNGIVVKYRKYDAYLDEDGKHFDFTRHLNYVYIYDANWEKWGERTKKIRAINRFLSDYPKERRVMLDVYGYLPYSKIIAIDSDGDTACPVPHIYAPFDDHKRPFSGLKIHLYRYNSTLAEQEVLIENPDIRNKINIFPDTFPDPPVDEEKERLVAEVTVQEEKELPPEEKPFPDLEKLDEK